MIIALDYVKSLAKNTEQLISSTAGRRLPSCDGEQRKYNEINRQGGGLWEIIALAISCKNWECAAAWRTGPASGLIMPRTDSTRQTGKWRNRLSRWCVSLHSKENGKETRGPYRFRIQNYGGYLPGRLCEGGSFRWDDKPVFNIGDRRQVCRIHPEDSISFPTRSRCTVCEICADFDVVQTESPRNIPQVV